MFKQVQSFWFDSTKGGHSPRITTGDFTGDGRLDIALTFQLSSFVPDAVSRVILFEQKNNGKFEVSTQHLPSNNPLLISPCGLATADFNHDGRDDLVVANGGKDVYATNEQGKNYGTGEFTLAKSVVFTSSTGTFSVNTSQKQNWFHDTAIADFNKDGWQDVIVLGVLGDSFIMINDHGSLQERSDQVPVGLQDPKKLTQVISTYDNGWYKTAAYQHLMSVETIDANRDGYADIFAAGYGPHSWLWLNDGKGNFSNSIPLKVNADIGFGGQYLAHFVDPGPNYKIDSLRYIGTCVLDTAVMDIDNDGWNDMICLSTFVDIDQFDRSNAFTNYKNTYVQVLLNNGGVFKDATKSVIDNWHVDTGNGWAHQQIKAIDLNKDGYKDLVITRGNYGSVQGAETAGKDTVDDTIFFINNQHGKFDRFQVPGLPNGDYTAIDINGKIALIGVSDPAMQSQYTGQMQMSVWIPEDQPAPTRSGESHNEIITQIYQLYLTIFNREPDVDGARYWISKIQSGTNLADAARDMVTSPEFYQLHGAGTHESLLTRCYKNVLGRDPDANGYAWWLEQMEHNAATYTPDCVVSSFIYTADELGIIGVQPINPEIYT